MSGKASTRLQTAVARFLTPLGVEVIRAGALDALPAEPRVKPCITVISASAIGAAKFTLDQEAAHGMPVIWVGAPDRKSTPAAFRPSTRTSCCTTSPAPTCARRSAS